MAKKKVIGIAVVVYFIAAILILMILKFPHTEKIDNEWDMVGGVNEGIQLLSCYDSQDAAAVEKEVRSVQEAIARRLAGGQAGEADLAAAFADAVVMGDSQAAALDAYAVLPSRNVAATIGRSIITAEEDIAKAIALNPRQIFITYGMNDCLIYSGNTERFIGAYSGLIDRLQASVPEAQIYICSIIIPSDAAIQKKPALAAVGDYNAALQQLAAQRGMVYIDAGVLLHPDLYAPDGLHMKKSFYRSWAYFMGSSAGLIPQSVS